MRDDGGVCGVSRGVERGCVRGCVRRCVRGEGIIRIQYGYGIYESFVDFL